jgi:hypothetical protein
MCGPFIHATREDWGFHALGLLLNVAFFAVALGLMLDGLINSKSAVATVGFYFSVAFVSNIIGTTYMLPSSGHYATANLWTGGEAVKPLWNIIYPFNGYSYKAVTSS